jgi:hypothetical protein
MLTIATGDPREIADEPSPRSTWTQTSPAALPWQYI